MNQQPETLMEAIRYFSGPDVCLGFVVSLRWPDGVVTCPTCGRDDVRFIPTRRIWECRSKHPKRQFSVKVGTIFEDSPIGLDKWLAAIWLIANAKNGVSSYEVHRAIGVTQKTAWFMLHRIRLAMQSGDFDKMSGFIEVDETFIGGRATNMHKSRRENHPDGQGGKSKTAVMGVLQRGEKGKSKVRGEVVENTRGMTLMPIIHKNVRVGSSVFSDASVSYNNIGYSFIHAVVDHATEYVRGRVHTNGLENFWSLLKRAIKGTYVNVSPFHLMRYVEEETFRYNARAGEDSNRFSTVVHGITGKRLTYRELTAANTTPA